MAKAQSPSSSGGKRSVNGTNSGGTNTGAAAAGSASVEMDESASVASGVGETIAEQDSDDESDDGRLQSADPPLRRQSNMIAGRFMKKLKLVWFYFNFAVFF